MARQETYYDSTVSRNISVSGSSYEFGLDSSDQILLSIQDDLDFNLNTFVLEQNIDYIISNNEIFLKPNDILDKEETPTGTYNLKFTYCRNILQEFALLQVYDNPVHVVTEISNTRTEVRLRVRDKNNYNILSINPNISTGYINKIKQDKFSSEESLDTYHFDYVIDTGDQNFIPINNVVIDTISNADDPTIIFKVNSAIPNTVGDLSEVSIYRILKPTFTERVYYVSEIPPSETVSGLTPDRSFEITSEDNSDLYQNYNQLVKTGSLTTEGQDIIETFLKSEYKNLNINFNDFEKHTIFGNVQQKITNFDYKVQQIEGKLNQLSSSLADTGSNSIVERRLKLFNDITDIKKKFTPFEKFLYYDNQSESTASAPGLGPNLADAAYSVRSHISSSKLSNIDGFSSVYKIERKGSKTRLFTEKYEVQSRPFFNTSQSIYLSFLMKATPGISSSLFFKPDEYDKPPYAKWAIPHNAIHTRAVHAPQPSTSSYQRYVFVSSASHWSPTGSFTQEDVSGSSYDVGNMVKTTLLNMFDATAENTHYKLVSPSTDTLEPIFDSSGRYGELVIPSIYNNNLLDFGTTRTGSVAPSGDLFNIGYSGSADNPVSESFITDIKVSFNDPDDALPFSYIYNTTSSIYNNWYGGMIVSASAYDDENIYSLINNLPEHYQTSADEAELRKFVFMLGEVFDIIYMYTSNVQNVASRKYKVTEAAPSDLTPLIAQSLGWKCLYALSSSLADRLDWESNQLDNDKNNTLTLSKLDAAKNTWQKVLNNLIYVYKSKGTKASLRAMLGIFGVSPDIVNIMSVGGSLEEQNPQTIANDTKNLLEGLSGTTGNVGFRETTANLNMVDLTTVTGSDQHLNLDWWTNEAKADGFEFVMLPSPSATDTELIINSGSNAERMWDLTIVPSASSSTTASVRLRINSTENGTGSIATHPIVVQTPNIEGLTDNTLWNVLITRTSGSVTNVNQTYRLYVANQDNTSIPNFYAASASVASAGTGSNVNLNFTGTGSLAVTASGNLKFGTNLTGSVEEIRTWENELSASKFKQHVLNKKSTVSNDVEQDDLIYHYRLNEGYSGSVTLADANPNKIKDFSLPVVSQSIDEIKITTAPIEQVTFTPRNGTETINDNSVIIDPVEPMNAQLSPAGSVVTPVGTDSKRVVNNDFRLSFSITNAVNEYIIDQITDFNLGQKFGPDSYYSGSYQDLESFRKTLLSDVSADMNKNIDTVTDAIKNVINQAICDIVPAKSEVIVGYEVESDMLHRNKIQHHKTTVETSSFEVANLYPIDSASYNEGLISAIVNYNPGIYTDTIFVSESSAIPTSDFSKPFSSSIFVSESTARPSSNIEQQKSASIFISQSTALITSSFVTENKFNLSVANKTTTTAETSSYMFSSSLEPITTSSIDINLGYRSIASLTSSWGTSSNDTHFIAFGSDSGSEGDFNIGYYEDDYYFISIGDNEYYSASVNYVTCSERQPGAGISTDCSNGYNFDYTNYRHFYNQTIDYDDSYIYDNKYSSSINLVKGRPIGATLYFTESNGNLVYPANHASIVGSTKDMMSKLFYEGTQNDGSQPVNDPKGRDGDSTKAFNTSSVAGSNTLNAIYVKREEKK